MTRVQYAVNGLALLAIAVGLAVYDARTLGCLLMACILSAAIGISLGGMVDSVSHWCHLSE